MLTLVSPIEQINKVGKATAKKLQKLDIHNVYELVHYYPFRYNDYTKTLPIARLRAGENANTRGMIEFIQNRRSFHRRMTITECLIKDDAASLKIIWFNQPYISKTLKVGDFISVSGLPQDDIVGLQMISPEYEKIINDSTTHTRGLVPVYNLTGGLTNKQLRFLVKSVIGIAGQVEDFLPRDILKKYNLTTLAQSIKDIHFPKTHEALEKAKRRLCFDEWFLVQLASQIKKFELKKQSAESLAFFETETKQFVAGLPFELTAAQKKAAWEIIKDLKKTKPMSRLLEGDVGSGKTVTVALAMLNAALNKKQSALLVPTEILASQHYETLRRLFQATDVKIGLFTRSNKLVNNKQIIINSKKEVLKLLQEGDVDIVVGTHAMIQENVKFKNLALAIIDEQHRFGVKQRQALREKSGNTNTIPHLLSMTATPIPRSLAQAVYGDLDLSIINQMPKGRKPIQTMVIDESKRADAYELVRTEINKGRQAFVVCPLITESDKLGVKSVEQEFKKLTEDIFTDLNIACLHGRVKAEKKEEIMQQFLDNKINILVSTSVIEVGVDVPNATIMIIEGAERFGMAQLHQFRGRVGRSDLQSFCLLFAGEETKSKYRLEIFANNSDGFKLAEEDLKMRGPGEVYGTAQKGFPEFKIAKLNDYELIKNAKQAAEKIISFGIDKYPKLLEKIQADKDWVVG